MYWPKCLTYGNWGGPGWSGGEFVSDPELTNWDIMPIDAMDALFYSHDWVYQHPGEGLEQWEADIVLSKNLYRINVTGCYQNAYRFAAMVVFFIKGNIGKIFANS